MCNRYTTNNITCISGYTLITMEKSDFEKNEKDFISDVNKDSRPNKHIDKTGLDSLINDSLKINNVPSDSPPAEKGVPDSDSKEMSYDMNTKEKCQSENKGAGKSKFRKKIIVTL